MTIELITPEQHAQILDIYTKFPALNFQNDGFEYLDKSKFTPEEKEAFETVENILKIHVKGFDSFNNFKTRDSGEIVLRFQFDWNADKEQGGHFEGVGYLKLNELLNGFK